MDTIGACVECEKRILENANLRCIISRYQQSDKEQKEELKNRIIKSKDTYIEKKLDLLFDYISNKKKLQNKRNPNFKKIRINVLERDRRTCQHCKIENLNLEVHHILPVSKGGGDNLENLITLCKECHKLIREDEFFKRKNDGVERDR